MSTFLGRWDVSDIHVTFLRGVHDLVVPDVYKFSMLIFYFGYQHLDGHLIVKPQRKPIIWG